MEQYWDDDPWLVVAYREADKLKTERMNHEAWLHGFYVFNAVSISLSNAFRKQGSPAEKYPEPARITPLTKLEEEDKELKEWERVKSSLNALKSRFNQENSKTRCDPAKSLNSAGQKGQK